MYRNTAFSGVIWALAFTFFKRNIYSTIANKFLRWLPRVVCMPLVSHTTSSDPRTEYTNTIHYWNKIQHQKQKNTQRSKEEKIEKNRRLAKTILIQHRLQDKRKYIIWRYYQYIINNNIVKLTTLNNVQTHRDM